LHELVVDGPSGVEFFGGASELLLDYEELALQAGGALGRSLIGEYRFRRGFVGEDAGALELGEASLGRPQPVLNSPGVGPGVLQIGA
jgi:hypothetical protein